MALDMEMIRASSVTHNSAGHGETGTLSKIRVNYDRNDLTIVSYGPIVRMLGVDVVPV